MSKESIMKIDYEIMHASVKELSSTYGIPESIISGLIKTEKWTPRKFESEEQQLEAVNDHLKTVAAKNQTKVIQKFLQLQEKIFSVASALLDNITAEANVTILKTVSDVIELHRPAILREKKADEAGEGGMKIYVISKFGDHDAELVNAVQISESAGLTNGVGAVNRVN